MAYAREFIPSSPPQPSRSTDSSSSFCRAIGIAPMTSRTVSSVKPFLLGFAAAVIVFSIATISSIHALCNNLAQTHGHRSTISNGASYHHNSECLSSPSIVTKHAERKEGVKQSLTWRETQPVLSALAPKQKEKTQQTAESTPTCDEGRLLQTRSDHRNCICNLVLESFRFDWKSENVITKDGLENENSVARDQQQLKTTHQFPTAFTPEVLDLSKHQEILVTSMRTNVLKKVSDFQERSSLVPWGGPPLVAEALSYDWFARKNANHGLKNAPLDQIDGGNLFSSYLRIMKWPDDLSETDFPFKLCKEKKKTDGKSCDTSDAIQHSLEFRERFKPWLVTPSIKRVNTNGLAYTHGFSPPHAAHEQGGHAIVWLRLARRVKINDEKDRIFFVRSMIREFDRGVAASLQQSNGRVGKFNAIVDGKDFTWSSMPSLNAVKTLVAILQDHFADRLGVIILVNIGSIGEVLLKLFLPLITEEVRNKIVLLPHNPTERLEALKVVLGPLNNIPVELGGTDDYHFDIDEYYSNDSIARDEEALEYLTTMPYHA